MLLDFFQLREQPFSVSPHPSYLYSSRNRSEALDSLGHAAASPNGVFALLGPAGAGKTTLLNQFLANLPSSTRAILLPHSNLSAPELLDYLSSELDATVRGEASPSLGHNLHSGDTRTDRNYVLVVDNAEDLDPTILNAISRWADSDAGLSVILAGRPKLLDKLRGSPSPLSFATKSLEPLSGPETAAYIQHRLRVAGHPGIGLLEREALALIAERSQGIPRNINQICFRALLEAYATGCHTVSAEIVEKAAQKLDSGEAPQTVSKLRSSQPNITVSGRLHPMPQGRLQSRNRISSLPFLSQSLLRRAAVAALAATTLALPYLAAKRISESIRPGISTATIPAQTLASKASSDIAPLTSPPGSSESATRPPSLPERVPIVPSSQPLNLTSPSANHEAIRQTPDRSATERMEVTSSPRLSLARELGLKINRIAIDPGHGGYDTGTIGPSGLMEKDLCLDVALRLGRMIKENIPGAEVIYTRTDDRHLQLEERTAIANDAQADLFISIHANSSDTRQIRGVETYYVSLAASPEAREIATRENAVGDSSLHNLPDLIKKITRNENMAESRQLASDIQNSLSQRLQLVSHQETNRGVKRAPFIVLTGANMPAVLSEISFLSNPADEKLLTEHEQRQRVTEGLYRGILAYLGSMPVRPLPEHTRDKSASAGVLSSTQTDGLR